jgi:DMSO/TMAO reductase YedYZ molybdopterin-dependent catalytic subunit
VSPEANQIVGRSVDGWTCGFPVAAAFDRNALIAVGMNGEPLPIEHGFPARLVVPGLYGYVSAVKWLAEIELTTFDAFDPYWVRRGWSAEEPIETMARIDTPQALATIPAGPRMIGGVAWAQTRGIDKVEVSIDDGPWQTARLAGALGLDTWRQWTLRWEAEPGSHTITARATDGTGELQTDERAEPFPDGASGWQSLLVTVEEQAA